MSKRVGSAKGVKPNRNRIKPVKQARKMRKSSLSRAQKNFSVFQQQSHENQYDSLQAIKDESEGIGLNSDDIDEVSVSEDNLEDGSDFIELEDEDEDEEKEDGDIVAGDDNSLDANDDFIAFDLSEPEEEEPEYEFEEEHSDDETSATDGTGDDVLKHNSDYPWILNHDHSKQREIADWLTLEIKDFVAYISPNRQEIEQRNQAIAKLKAAVTELWPDSNLNCFGSFATDLYLPGSDIDCVVRSASGDKENRNALYSLASFLKRKDLATQVEVIAKARVPIIKFVEPESRIHIDVSFERTNGLEAARVIRAWLDEQPGLRELVLIVKQFLHARRLNNVHTGGLGGYSIICLVYTFLKLHPRILTGDIDPLENLGVLLIDFFELYGKNFGYDDVGISVNEHEAKYIPKNEHPDLSAGRPRFSLLIQDPGDASNNISRGSFNLRDIKKGFAGAFDLLTNRCFELDSATFKDRIGSSILGNVIKYKGIQRDFNDERNLVINEAIQENEKYHNKRGRIVHDDLFTEMSDVEAEEEIYQVQEPLNKKSKKDKSKEKSKEKHDRKKERKERRKEKKDNKNKEDEKTADTVQIIEEDEEDNYDPTKAIVINDEPSEKEDDYDPSKPSVDDYMGLQDTNDDDNDEEQAPAKNSEEATPVIDLVDDEAGDSDESNSDLKMQLVDKQTKRDYWLSKGQAM
ncbi:unnamed protein product [Kluyveromyces dobzhanskii CBS 2104]|uniref:polynucleotide adenylyltransferase n=1 Tax=Kluyveromyces dobzhanskii CBS 2104 TaxID=1427455 RepID=A0A0A8L0T2_9SACH|nr:unnamed protein product [Kluyveromyces dobzhanskii CBS 2104]